jgi:peptide chain release factor 2
VICAPLVSPSTNVSRPFGGVFDLAGSERRLQEIEQAISQPGAWDKPEALTPLLQEKRRLEDEVERLGKLKTCCDDMNEWLALAAESEDPEALESLDQQRADLARLLDETELVMLLSGEEDGQDAILEIHPGAGGTESQDWAEMLLRMYTRWAARRHYTVEELDFLPGDEAGIKSVTLRIAGPHAYGFLKSERGIHRLIRISPFDSSGRRHTSFASVDVIPDAGDDIQLDIKESDIRVDIFRSSGPGGQSVNTTSSAVRVTHLPTGISAQCQNEKSQPHNRETAMRVLRARLYNLELQKREAQRQAQYAGKDAIAFGSQIRTYTLQPYRLVKDHRTGTEMGDVEAVLDGQIDRFQHDYLLYRHEQERWPPRPPGGKPCRPAPERRRRAGHADGRPAAGDGPRTVAGILPPTS